MEAAIEKIQQVTSRGQITLPALWRRKFNPNQILVKTKGDILEISSISFSKRDKTSYYTVFDALRDNKGKGIKAIDLLKLLRKINNKK